MDRRTWIKDSSAALGLLGCFRSSLLGVTRAKDLIREPDHVAKLPPSGFEQIASRDITLGDRTAASICAPAALPTSAALHAGSD